MNYLIGTDIGTSGTKSIIMDTDGNLIADDLQEYDVLTPQPLWAEQWPDIWLDAVKRSIRAAVAKAGVAASDIKGLCISGLYGGSGIPVDREMKPVRPCMIWLDRRASQQSKWVVETVGEEKLQRITHNGADPYYGFTKILWIKEEEPDNWNKINLFLPPNAYVIYHLTNEIAIDYPSAGNLGGIFDMEKREWSKELMHEMGIPVGMMPERLVECSEVVGGLTAASAGELGLETGMPIFSGGVDCAAASLALGVFEPGKYAAAIGASMCAALVHDYPLNGKGLIEWPYVYNSRQLSYSFGGSATAGAIVKWFRNNFAELEIEVEQQGGESAYEQLNRMAAVIPAGSQGLIVLPYFMGERSPVWDINARGTIVGLSLSHTKAHIYRAFLESVAYSLRHAMECTGESPGDYILVAGGVTKSKLWRQIIADVTGYPIVCPINNVEANLGDVMLAGIGTGLLTWEQIGSWQVLDGKVMPDPEAYRKYNEYYRLYHSVYKHLKQDMEELAMII